MHASAWLSAGAILVVAAVVLVARGPWREDAPEASVGPAERPPALAASEPSLPAVGPEVEAPSPPAGPAPMPAGDRPPSARVSGSVVQEDGAPVAGAEVFLIVHHDDGGDLRAPPQHMELEKGDLQKSRSMSVTADSRGLFLFEAVPFTGRARICAFRDGSSGGTKLLALPAGAVLDDVSIEVAAGKTLRGRVLAAAGGPLADAIVSVTDAWDSDDVVPGSGLAATDAEGRFRIGVGRRAERATLRVNSESRGQDFFQDIPVEGEATLVVRDDGVLRGRIAWTGGTPASGLIVRAYGSLPVPPPLVRKNKLVLRPHRPVGAPPEPGRNPLGREAGVDEAGAYEITDLEPGIAYHVRVVDIEKGRKLGFLTPMDDGMQFSPGEVKVWDRTVDRPVTVNGAVVTESRRTPVPRADIRVWKGGGESLIKEEMSGPDGRFRVRITQGPGSYLIQAGPHTRAGRLAVALTFAGGEEVDIEVPIYEPVVLPVRVLDADGEPAAGVGIETSIGMPDGTRLATGGPCPPTDAYGRTAIRMYREVSELQATVRRRPDGPPVTTRRYSGGPGTTFPEETLVLPRTCDISAVVFGQDGEPRRKAPIGVRAVYGDGTDSRPSARTDEEGRFTVKGAVRATAFTVRINVQGVREIWDSGPLDGTSGTVDLGPVVVRPPAEPGAAGKDAPAPGK